MYGVCTLSAIWAAAPAHAASQRRGPPHGPAPRPSGSARGRAALRRRRLSRYAGAVARARVRAEPTPLAARVGRLHYLTEDGPFEVYPVLASHVDGAGRTWLRIRLPMRPNGRTEEEETLQLTSTPSSSMNSA